MNIIVTLLLLSLFALPAGHADAQPRWKGEGGPGQRPERLEKFRKMRLIEVLRLKEDEAVRFFAKQNGHEETVRGLMKSRNDIVDRLEEAVKEDGESATIGTIADQLMEVDKKIFEERQRYQGEMRQFLSPAQFGRFLVFERNFGRQVRDALEEMHQEKGRR